MREEPDLAPESEMSEAEFVKRYELSRLPEPPPATPAKRRRRRERMLARMAHYAPSERNRRIFEEVVVKHESHEKVAFTERLSRQRVAVIVQRMRDWYAYWGGDDAAYAPEQKQRLANHVAALELTEYQRQLEKLIENWVSTTERKKWHFDLHGERDRMSEVTFQSHIRPTNLYRLLLSAILARAKVNGASLDHTLAAATPGGQNQAMVVRTEVNVSPTGTSTPPKEALRSDILSESTCVEGRSDTPAATEGANKD